MSPPVSIYDDERLHARKSGGTLCLGVGPHKTLSERGMPSLVRGKALSCVVQQAAGGYDSINKDFLVHIVFAWCYVVLMAVHTYTHKYIYIYIYI